MLGEDDDSSYNDSVETVMRYDSEFMSSFFKAGFGHTIVAFAVSAIVINTVSTYIDTLLAARGHNRIYTGVVGFSFQIVVMLSSFVVGGNVDHYRNYFAAITTLLLVGAGFLALCGYALEGNAALQVSGGRGGEREGGQNDRSARSAQIVLPRTRCQNSLPRTRCPECAARTRCSEHADQNTLIRTR